MSEVVFLNLLSAFSMKSSESNPSLQQSKPHQISTTSFPIVDWLRIFPFSVAILTDIALWAFRILFLIQGGIFELPEALYNHTLSKLCFLIHELYLKNLLSFQELLNTWPSTTFPESCNLSCFKSNINKLDLISLSA